MIPKRIQRKRTKGSKMPPNTIFVGRPSKWGNPFKTAEEFRNDLAIKRFRDPLAYATIRHELRGKNLSCWCPFDQLCHADVLLEIANPEILYFRKHTLLENFT